MDVIALIYAIWLCVLFSLTRAKQEKVWSFFKWFVFVLTLLQYILLVGFPPSFCFRKFYIIILLSFNSVICCYLIIQIIEYPWTTTILKHLQEWAWLPDTTLRMQSSKLLLDFILLMIVCRQMLVFRLENQYEAAGTEFLGGTNKSVIEDINNLGKEPLTNSHDFVTTTRSAIFFFPSLRDFFFFCFIQNIFFNFLQKLAGCT